MYEPYKEGKISRDRASLGKIYVSRSPVEGRLVTVLNLSLTGRRLQLIQTPSRALVKHEIHELVGTNEDAAPGQEVGNAWYLGFFEVTQGGVILHGDEVAVGDRTVGEILGFDETHMPNHINIVVKLRQVATGLELGLKLWDKVVIRPPSA